MNIKCEIFDATVYTKSGTSKVGNPYSFHFQKAYLHTGERFPLEIEVMLKDEKSAYTQGEYFLSNTSISVNKFRQPEFKRELVLISAKPSVNAVPTPLVNSK